MTEKITDQQVRDLRDEAATAGDAEQVRICDEALGGDSDARTECSRVIAEAQSMAENAAKITVKIAWQRRRKDFDVAVYNCKWMGGTYDTGTKTWAIPAERIADVERFVASGLIEIV